MNQQNCAHLRVIERVAMIYYNYAVYTWFHEFQNLLKITYQNSALSFTLIEDHLFLRIDPEAKVENVKISWLPRVYYVYQRLKLRHFILITLFCCFYKTFFVFENVAF